MNEQQIAKAKELRSKGRSFLSIADEIGVPVKAVFMCINGLEWNDYYNKEKQVAANKRSAKKKKEDRIRLAREGARIFGGQVGKWEIAKAINELCDMYEKKRRL